MMIRLNDEKNDAVLGIDFGSGSVKIVLLDTQSRLIGQRRAPYPTATPRAGWAQQNPDDWISAFQTAMPALLAETGFDARRIRCIAVCGAAHVPVLLDRDDRPTCPAILWNDCRSGKEVEHLDDTLGEYIVRNTANKPGCAWTLPQLLWLKKHHSEAFKRTVTFLTLKDYFLYLLTGEKTSDPGSATATMAYNIRANAWDDELIDLTSLPRSAFPGIVDSVRPVGTTVSRATRFGFAVGTPVISGCLDSVAEMIAAGAKKENDTVIRLGTAGALLTLQDNREYTAGMLTYPFPSELLAIKQAGTNCCGKSIDWICEVLSAAPDELNRLASLPVGSEGLFFHPFLQGERTPYNNPDLRGSFIGLSVRHRREHFLRAVLEGVCFSIKDCVGFARNHICIPDAIHVIGGGVCSTTWMSILADVLGIPIIPNKESDSALGMAVLALKSIDCPYTRRNSEYRTIYPAVDSFQEYALIFDRYKLLADQLNSFYSSAFRRENSNCPEPAPVEVKE